MSGFAEADLPGLELCPHGERRKYCKSCNGNAQRALAREDANVSEALIEAECTKLLEQDGWRALRTDPVSDRGRGTGFGELGMADHLYFRYRLQDNLGFDYAAVGRLAGPIFDSICQVLWIEFKSAGGKPKKHQIEWHQKERARGALTWIAGVDFPASVAGFVEHYRISGLNRGRI